VICIIELYTKGDAMPLVQKAVGSTTYYTDGVNYYLFHPVNAPKDALTEFASRELGIPMKPKFAEEESKRLAQLAGTGVNQETKVRTLEERTGGPGPVSRHRPSRHTKG